MQENNKKKKENDQKKKKNKEKKLKEGETLILCKDKCQCIKPNGKCVAIGLKQCIIYQLVVKSQCGKKTCRSHDDQDHDHDDQVAKSSRKM